MPRAAAVVVLLLLAGCLSPDPDAGQDALDGAEAPAPAAAGLDLRGADCFEGGGHSVHPVSLNPLPEPWTPADVLDDVGQQVVYSEVPDPAHPVPERGHTMGNYHATVVCADWTFGGEARPGMVFGFVGMRVEAPPFGTPGPDHEYLVTVVASSDEGVRDALQAGGIHPMTAAATVEAQPGGVLSIHLETDHNGVYDSVFRRADAGPLHAPWVRLWFLAHGDNETFSPVALDLFSEGGVHFTADGQGYFSHTGTDHHAPLPGAYGHTAALGYDGFDRTFAWGPRPDVALSDAYVH